MINPARVRRYARAYREHLSSWRPQEWPAETLAAQQRVAVERMAQQDAAIARGCGLMARTTASMAKAGPLRTDERPAALYRSFAAGVLTAEDLV